jgi:hypothetical protein
VIDAYTAEGFNFLALKLVPGQDVSAMQPVRVTTQGASPNLPLRMVAVGSGATVPINLWIIAEGRYDTVNMPSFQMDPSKLVWNWDTQSSNYSTLKDGLFKASNNRGWLIVDAEPFSMLLLQQQLTYVVQSDPVKSGYADAMGQNAEQNLAADMATLFAGINPTAAWVTYFEGDIAHEALTADLQIGAAADQSVVSRTFNVTQAIGTDPCQATCGGNPPITGSGGSFPFLPNGNGTSGKGSCATSRSDDPSLALLGGAGLTAALAFTRRRRRSTSAAPR